MVFDNADPYQAALRFAKLKKTIASTTEFLWHRARVSFPQGQSKSNQEDTLKVLGGTVLPNDVKKELNRGPKFCYQPHTNRPQLVATIRRMGGLVDEEEDRGRAIGDGIDCLLRNASDQQPSRPPFKKIIRYLKSEGLTVL